VVENEIFSSARIREVRSQKRCQGRIGFPLLPFTPLPLYPFTPESPESLDSPRLNPVWLYARIVMTLRLFNTRRNFVKNTFDTHGGKKEALL
jgi:hypothetical protein